MKINIFDKKTLALLGCATLLAACSENSWNDNLDGFEVPGITQVETVSYTLTDEDYATLAGLSDNKALAGDGLSKALKAVGTQHYFTSEIPASKYVPAFLANSKFPYFTLSKGSAVKVTYNEAQAVSPEIAAIGGAGQYVVSDEDYQQVWGSDNDYTPSFAPSHTASQSLPGLLSERFPEAKEGEYVIVNYETSDTDPVFNQPDTPDTPEFTMSDVISKVEEGSTYDINGVVTAVCTVGFILTDNSGSIFSYMPKGYDPATYPVGTQLVVKALIGSYNLGFQIDGSNSTFEAKGTVEQVEYPATHVFTVEELEAIGARSENAVAQYGSMSGEIVVGEKNINILVGSDKVQGSLYNATDDIKAALANGETMTVTGYVIAVAGKGKYINMVATKVEAGEKKAPRHAPAKVVSVPSVNENAVYYFNGKKWAAAASTVILNPADYTAMGQKYGNLSATAKPEDYLPAYLKLKLPYAQADDHVFVVYKYYEASTKETNNVCNEYVYDGAAWSEVKPYVTVTSQFVKQDVAWVYDPSVTITLPNTKGNVTSQTFYQACVDWVFQNIDKPLGSTDIKSGVGYVTSYGNNEYYSGTSAYQCNVDLRAASARSQYAKGYEGMTDEEVVAKMKERLVNEVMPGALAILYPDAVPVEGVQVIYTVNFYTYTGSAEGPFAAKFEVVGKGEFKFISCDW